MPGDVLPSGHVGHGEVGVEAEEATDHDQQQPDHHKPKTKQRLAAEPSVEVEAILVEHQRPLQEKHQELKGLGCKEPIEIEAVTFANAGTNPRTVMVVGPYTATAVPAMFATKRLM